MNDAQLRRAGRAIAIRINEMSASVVTVARAAGIHPKTLRAIIRGDRWPTDSVQSRLESVLMWRDGEMAVRAVHGQHASLDAFSDAELAEELANRLRRRDDRYRRTRPRGGARQI